MPCCMQEVCGALKVESSAVLFPLGPGCAWMSTTLGAVRAALRLSLKVRAGPVSAEAFTSLSSLSSVGSFCKRSTCVHMCVHM